MSVLCYCSILILDLQFELLVLFLDFFFNLSFPPKIISNIFKLISDNPAYSPCVSLVLPSIVISDNSSISTVCESCPVFYCFCSASHEALNKTFASFGLCASRCLGKAV